MNSNKDNTKSITYNYKIAILFFYWPKTMFVISVISIIYNICLDIKNNNFTIFSILLYIVYSLISYLILWKASSWFQKSFKEQINNIDNGKIIMAKVISIKHSIRFDSDRYITIYTCIDDNNNRIEVNRYSRFKEQFDDVKVGQYISVLLWKDRYREYYDWTPQTEKTIF